MLAPLMISALLLITLLPLGSAVAHQFVPPEIVAKIPPREDAPFRTTTTLAEQGRRIFETEQFGGNGRTCATCHPRSNNFTLDPAFIKRLSNYDPLFVFERVPALRGLENGKLLRSKALILENLDGFDQPGTMRSVMHLFALGLSTNPVPGFPLTHALGWSGDGSPGDGSLRSFTVGAIVQHMPKTLARVEGTDFRMPTAQELDALEAFQLSLGRRADLVLDPAIAGHLTFSDTNVTVGQTLFAGMPSRQGTRRCSGCHTGAGALNDLNQNEQRATGVDRQANAPACLDPTAPGDGGFLAEPAVTVDRSTFCGPGKVGPVTFRGNLFFSTQSIVEAADTGPFFHDNSAATLEQVIDHYRSDAFNNSVTGAGNGFLISDDQRNQIAAFLRAVNTLDNIRAATTSIRAALRPRSNILKAMADARNDVDDAIGVLSEQSPILIYQTTALPALKNAKRLLFLSSRLRAANAELERARLSILALPPV